MQRQTRGTSTRQHAAKQTSSLPVEARHSARGCFAHPAHIYPGRSSLAKIRPKIRSASVSDCRRQSQHEGTLYNTKHEQLARSWDRYRYQTARTRPHHRPDSRIKESATERALLAYFSSLSFLASLKCTSEQLRRRTAACSAVRSRWASASNSKPTINLRTVALRSRGG